MKKNGILSGTVRFFASINEALARAASCEPVGFSKTDFAILQVAMMVSALDGDVTAEEISAFGKMAKKCIGYTPDEAEKALCGGFRSAGYLMLLARASGEKKIVDEFVAEACSVLPKDFAFGRIETVRQALVTWVSMAMSDGDYSGIERKAIAALVQKIEDSIGKRTADGRDLWASISPIHAVMRMEGQARKSTKAPTKEFLDKAERLLGQLKDESTAVAATSAIKELVLNG